MDYLNEGFANVYENDLASQEKYMEIFAEEIRKCDKNILIDAGGVFIPNNEYMQMYFGPITMIHDYSKAGVCNWLEAIVFPIRDITDEIVGIEGYFPLNKLHKENGETLFKYNFKYKVSDKSIFNSSLYFFGMKGIQRKALEDGYVILTDGTFDALSLTHIGYNALALLGSSVSKQQIAYLSMLDTVYLAVDNDRAGQDLLKYLKKNLPNVKGILFTKSKDVDDILKGENREEFISQLDRKIQENLPGDIRIKL